MNTFELSREYAWFLVLLVLIVSTIFAIIAIPKMKAAKKRRQQIRERDAKIRAEQERIANLPKLDTRFLVKAPDKWAQTFYGQSYRSARRMFGNRYNRLVVFDENGDTWVGLFHPDTLRSLKAAEYVQGDFWVPFRGAGESYHGPEVEIINFGGKIDIYPLWFNFNLLDTQEWLIWSEFETAFRQAFSGRNYHSIFAEILPYDHLHKVSQSKEELEQLLKQQADTK